MWVLKLKLKHDCTIGDRCEEFNIISYSIPLGNWKQRNHNYTSERHTLEGENENIKRFIKDLKKDKRITKLEVDKNTLFFIGKSKESIPSSFYSQKMFFTKPVFVNEKGYEFWEIGSYKKSILSEFLKNLEKQDYNHLEVLKFKNIKLNNIYFPAIAPNLTDKQKEIFELAVRKGYYDIPKKTDLIKLAKIKNISVATFQEHLRRAESKIVPKLRFTK